MLWDCSEPTGMFIAFFISTKQTVVVCDAGISFCGWQSTVRCMGVLLQLSRVWGKCWYQNLLQDLVPGLVILCCWLLFPLPVFPTVAFNQRANGVLHGVESVYSVFRKVRKTACVLLHLGFSNSANIISQFSLKSMVVFLKNIISFFNTYYTYIFLTNQGQNITLKHKYQST